MCGIYGIISNLTKDNSSKAEVLKMMQKSAYRGPDSQQIISLNQVCFGFNRLAIIDLDKRSDQPLNLESIGKLIVFNGEIYNYLEIKKELLELGYSFKTDSDTEVALIAFHHYGVEAFNLFNGMWAMCIYDYTNNQITLSRDRFGVKPLYYMFQDECLYFASEIKSLLVVKKELIQNSTTTNQYLIYCQNKFSNGETLIEGIQEHPAGSFSKLRNNQLEIKRYYFIPKKEDTRDYKAIQKELLHNFKDALKLRMRSDVPVALLLSGGLDSSLIAYHINKMIENGELKNNKVHAFTLNFDGFNNNEWDIVNKFRSKLPHIICEPININMDSFKLERNKLINNQDVPSLSISHLIHVIALRQIKAKGFTVVLNGQGADEVFGGYFPNDMGSLLLDALKQSFQIGISEMKYIKKKWRFSLRKQVKSIIQSYIYCRLPRIYNFLKSKSLKENKYLVNPSSHFLNSKDTYFQFSSKMQIFESEFNGILNYEDSASMLNSIEMRSPFMDYRLINLGLSINPNLKLHQGFSKWILRDTLGELLPNEIRWATWKLGYAVPKQELLKELLNLVSPTSENELNSKWREYNLKEWFKFQNII